MKKRPAFILLILAILALVIIASGIIISYINSKNQSAKTVNNTISPHSNIKLSGDTKKDMQAVIADKFGLARDKVRVIIEKETDNYVRGRMSVGNNGPGNSGLFLAVYTGNEWIVPYDGGGPFLCDFINRYDFPPDMVSDCLAEDPGPVIPPAAGTENSEDTSAVSEATSSGIADNPDALLNQSNEIEKVKDAVMSYLTDHDVQTVLNGHEVKSFDKGTCEGCWTVIMEKTDESMGITETVIFKLENFQVTSVDVL